MTQTHDLVLAEGVLVKRFTSWDRGEHRREWTVLNVLHRHIPHLVPRPIDCDLEANPPWVSMTELPGRPLTGKLTAAQLDGLERALRAMWAVPAAQLPPRRYAPAEAYALGRAWFADATRPQGIAGQAVDAVRVFLDEPPLPEPDEVICGHSDSNLPNYLWDGQRVRIVDFEDAGGSDVAYELATLIEHLGARDTDWTGFLSCFDFDPQRLRHGRILAGLLWLNLLLPGNKAHLRNPPGTLEVQARRVLDLIAG
jgi:Ser/Thr protein kinase RdoA (MazF antagonist)